MVILFLFFPIVESPGIAFFYGRSSSSQSAIVNSFLASCPVLAIILVSALIIGTSFWLMVSLNTYTLRLRGICYPGEGAG